MKAIRKYSSLLFSALAFVVLLTFPAHAQKQHGQHESDFAASIFGQFTTSTDGNGVHQTQTYSPGALASFRQSYKPWLGYEINYGYNYSSDIYNGRHVQHDVHEATAAYLVQLHKFYGLEPFALAGGGALIFVPTDSPLSHQERPVGLYGVGVNYMPNGYRHVGLRFQYRGLVYRAPNFDQAALSSSSYRHTAEPTAGAFFRW